MPNKQSIGSRIARGASWMLMFRLTDRAIAFISTIVLARVLVPADFGLVAMATSVTTLIELTGAFSLEVGLIQRANPTREHYDTTWTMKLLFGLFGALVTVAVAPQAAAFYGDERLVAVLMALAGNWLLGSLENIGVVDFRRDLNFRREYVFLISKRLFSMPITIGIAVVYQTYWALIIGTTASTLASLLLSYAMHPYRPRFGLHAWRDLLSFSVWLFLNNLLSFLQLRLSHFIIGRTQGPDALGIYTVATDFAALASSEITAPVNRAVMPGLARLAGSAEEMKRGMLQVIGAVLLVTLPAAFGMAAVAEPMVLALLGEKWLPAVPVLQILAFAGAVQSVTANNHSAYLAAGKSQVPVFINVVFVLTLVPLLFALGAVGVVGVALAQFGATLAAVVASVVLMKRHIGAKVADLVGAGWRPLVAAATMGFMVHWLDQNHFGLAHTLPSYARLTAGVLAGVLFYVAAVAGLWFATGRPAGFERVIFERALAMRRRSGS